MDVNEFRARYNARVAELGASDKAECLGVINRANYQPRGLQDKAGDAHMMATRTQGVSIMHIGGAIKGAIVYAPMDSSKLMDGLVAYSACLDIMTGLSAKKRNELLAKLHLFDGKLTAKGSNRVIGEWLVEVRPGDPERGWISFTVVDVAAGRGRTRPTDPA